MSEELEVLKMLDAHPDVAIRFRDLMMSKTGQERLLMGCSMYDTAKQIVLSAIRNRWPMIADAPIKRELFFRFYGPEYSEADKDKLLSVLASE